MTTKAKMKHEVKKDIKSIKEALKSNDEKEKVNVIETIADKYSQHISSIGTDLTHCAGSMSGEPDLEIVDMDLEMLKKKLELFLKQ